MSTLSLPALWRSSWFQPLNDVRVVDDLLARIDPTWSVGSIKARVVAIVDETPDTRTFLLRPNRIWPGAVAGQHVLVEVEIGGVRHQRTYSLSGAPGPGRRATITVKRQAGGLVSNWLHDRLAVGDVLRLGAPAGAFVLPQPVPERLLLLAAGSGITPLMSMLRDLYRRGHAGSVVLVYACRSRADAIFGDELAALAACWPSFALHVHHSSDAGRLDVGTVARLVADYAARHTLLCGPAGFMATFRAHWRARGIERLHYETFGTPAPAASPGQPVEVRCLRSERVFEAPGAGALLVEAEGAGLRPRYGCRIGICHTCQCVKQSGTVENLLTGRVSSEPGERIQLCISRARSNLVLEL
jgi:ferredoxin-NADP reductase